MKKPVVKGTGVIASAVVAINLFGGGIASADFAGQTYGQASDWITSHNMKAEIATVVGDQLATNDCIVTSAKTSGFLNSSGKLAERAILLHLNCNQAVATAGGPGNSAATAAGKAAKKDMTDAAYFATNPEWCAPGGKYRSPCARVCRKNSSYCTAEMLDALAS